MAVVLKPKRSENSLAVPGSSDLEIGELAMNISDGKFFTKTSDPFVLLRRFVDHYWIQSDHHTPSI